MQKIKISEFDFDYTPFCDETVVRWLIENRCAVESRMEYDSINEDMIITYADLDDLTSRVNLSNKEKITLDFVMRGYSMADIQECYGGKRQAFRVFYQRAVRKICDLSKQEWCEFHGDCPAHGLCYR